MNSKKNVYVDIHVLQSVPASNINRDDTGSPKTCIYGGTPRARVSSQAWKHAVRLDFKNRLPEEDLGVRTKKIVLMVADEIRKLKPEMDAKTAEKDATKVLKDAGFNIKDSEKGTDALFLMSQKQCQALAELAAGDTYTKAECKTALSSNPSIDMALFGRMVASDPSLNYDAAVQVAHAVSTHQIDVEYDYFTAVDDLAKEDSAGASHIGVTEFDSSTLYRYATVNMMELEKSVGTAAPEAAVAFVESFVTTMPTGKMNSFANRTLPAAVYIAVRDDQPVNLVGAFEKAVPATSDGYVEASKARLVEEEQKIEDFVDAPYTAYTVGDGLEQLAESKPFKDVLNDLQQTLTALLKGE